jgi:hypothetical protein
MTDIRDAIRRMNLRQLAVAKPEFRAINTLAGVPRGS